MFGVALAGLLSGCTTDDALNTATRPGKFRLYSCPELDKHGGEVLKRERELAELIRRAGDGGGQIAAALAYRTEHNIAVSDLREIEQTGIEKKCALKYRSISEQIVR